MIFERMLSMGVTACVDGMQGPAMARAASPPRDVHQLREKRERVRLELVKKSERDRRARPTEVGREPGLHDSTSRARLLPD